MVINFILYFAGKKEYKNVYKKEYKKWPFDCYLRLTWRHDWCSGYYYAAVIECSAACCGFVSRAEQRFAWPLTFGMYVLHSYAIHSIRMLYIHTKSEWPLNVKLFWIIEQPVSRQIKLLKFNNWLAKLIIILMKFQVPSTPLDILQNWGYIDTWVHRPYTHAYFWTNHYLKIYLY